LTFKSEIWVGDVMSAQKKRVLVACGTGIATATLVSMKVEELLKRNGINAEVVRCRIHEIGFFMSTGKVDLIVATSQAPGAGSVPVINSVPIISGVGKDAVEKQIVATLKG